MNRWPFVRDELARLSRMHYAWLVEQEREAFRRLAPPTPLPTRAP